MAEIETRAVRYGLPAITWPPIWPVNSLAAMRAATWARAQEVGLDGDALPEAIQRQAIKDNLRQATNAAWTAGVSGAPILIVNGVVYYGDDQLELAASG